MHKTERESYRNINPRQIRTLPVCGAKERIPHGRILQILPHHLDRQARPEKRPFQSLCFYRDPPTHQEGLTESGRQKEEIIKRVVVWIPPEGHFRTGAEVERRGVEWGKEMDQRAPLKRIVERGPKERGRRRSLSASL